jgi:ribonucleoside-diphosphate reductase alpha chain
MKVTDLSPFHVIRRDGYRVDFDPSKIRNAIANAFLKDAHGQPRRRELTLSSAERAKVDNFAEQVVAALTRRKPAGSTIGVEEIQDQVELALMRAGEHEIARDYVLFRASRSKHRNAEKFKEQSDRTTVMIDHDERSLIGRDFIAGLVEEACEGIPDADPAPIVEQAMRDIYDEIPREKVDEAILLAARSMIEKDPAYGQVTARIFLRSIRREVIGEDLTETEMATRYASHLAEMVECGIAAKRLDPRLAEFDLARLGAALKPERDRQFRYIGLQTP